MNTQVISLLNIEFLLLFLETHAQRDQAKFGQQKTKKKGYTLSLFNGNCLDHKHSREYTEPPPHMHVYIPWDISKFEISKMI